MQNGGKGLQKNSRRMVLQNDGKWMEKGESRMQNVRKTLRVLFVSALKALPILLRFLLSTTE